MSRINSFFYGLPLACQRTAAGQGAGDPRHGQGQGAAGGLHAGIQEPGRRRRAEGARQPGGGLEAARRGWLRIAPADQRALADLVCSRRNCTGRHRLLRRRPAADRLRGRRHRDRRRRLWRIRDPPQAADGDQDDAGQRQDRRAGDDRASAQRLDHRARRPALPAGAGAHRHHHDHPSGRFEPVRHPRALARLRHGLHGLGRIEFARQRAARLLGLRRRGQPRRRGTMPASRTRRWTN